jgi:hypothetical protein
MGKFAVAFDDKLLVNWDETGSCHDVIDKIKSAITEDTITVERKGIDKIKKKNNASIVFTSNNVNTIPISESNRRFVIFESTDKYKINGCLGTTEFWCNFNKVVDTSEFISALYKYLNGIDLTTWNHANFPKTSSYLRSQSQSIPSEVLFIIDLLIDKTKNFKLKGTDLYDLFINFCNKFGLNSKFVISIKTFYTNMDVLSMKNNITGIQKKIISGGVVEFTFNYLKLNESLINNKYIPNPYQFVD